MTNKTVGRTETADLLRAIRNNEENILSASRESDRAAMRACNDNLRALILRNEREDAA